ncbi:MAG: Fur family transcriptional regulator [Solirubrobacteraceae bacterium]|nr:MAG: transcriptional repressor [Solirubrobacterales bacterium]
MVKTATTQVWADHARSVLERAGHHRGGARDAVIDLLAAQRCALSALEIEDALRAADRRVGRASIYRVLELLAHHRLIQRIELGDAAARYELAAPDGDHHHHLLCERCHRVVPFNDPGLERSIERLSGRLGFAVAEHDVVLHGACAHCAR